MFCLIYFKNSSDVHTCLYMAYASFRFTGGGIIATPLNEPGIALGSWIGLITCKGITFGRNSRMAKIGIQKRCVSPVSAMLSGISLSWSSSSPWNCRRRSELELLHKNKSFFNPLLINMFLFLEKALTNTTNMNNRKPIRAIMRRVLLGCQ